MRLNAVSIHPLLKLIQIDEAGVINLPCFNTSHVKVNQYRYYSALVFEYRFNTSHVKVNPTYFLHSIQYTIPDSPVFINVFKIFTSHRAICQKNLQNHRNATVFADSRNFALIGGW